MGDTFAMRAWWLIVLGALLGAAVAIGYTKFGPFPYQSVARVQMPPQTTSPNGNSGQAATATTNYTAEAATSQIFSEGGAE